MPLDPSQVREGEGAETLAEYLDFGNCAGLSERVISRELFLKGLTLLDLREQRTDVSLSMSHIAARQELRALLAAIKPPPAAQAGCADQEFGSPQKLMQGADVSGDTIQISDLLY